VKVDTNRKILNQDCQYYLKLNPTEYINTDLDYGFVLPTGFNLVAKNYESDNPSSDSTISTRYRGGRYGFSQKQVYVPLLKRYCQVYSKEGKTYYGYANTSYESPLFVTNLISNTEFANTSGWVGTYKSTGLIKDIAKIENVYG
jgi:hypothetical protein